MLEFLLSLLANDVIYPLIVPGIFGGVIAILFSYFIPVSLAQYKIPFLLGGVLLVLFFTFEGGKYMESSAQKIKDAETATYIAKLESASKEVTIQEVTKYVDKIKLVEKLRTEYVNVYVDRYITKEMDASYPLPNAFVVLHDAAVKGEVPGATGSSDASPSDIRLSTATKTITSNYFICRDNAEQLSSLQSWVRQQQELINK